MQQIEQDYVPYGPEWEKELMQFNKPALINLLRKAYEWKNQAVAVMPDLQKIGQLLNIPLGQNVSNQIIPKIEELQARLAAQDAGKESEGEAPSGEGEKMAKEWETELRKQFFNECTMGDFVDGTKIRIDFAPHDLFEWIRKNAIWPLKSIISYQELKLQSGKADTESAVQWETFCDFGYYGLWAVRPVGDGDFSSQKLFHVQTMEEATALCDLLNSNPK